MIASALLLTFTLAADGGVTTQAPAIDLGQGGLGLKAAADAGAAKPATGTAAPAQPTAPAQPPGPPPGGMDVSHLFFDKDDILKVIAFHTKEVQDCYEHVLAETEQKFEGRVMVDFQIDADGKVKEAKIRKKGTTMKEQRVHDCIIAAAYEWRFPKPPDGKIHPLTFPFDLKFVK